MLKYLTAVNSDKPALLPTKYLTFWYIDYTANIKAQQTGSYTWMVRHYSEHSMVSRATSKNIKLW